jgi:hypothetical protein
VRSAATVASAQVGQPVELHLLDLDQAFPLPPKQVIHFLVQMPDFTLGLEVVLVVVLSARTVIRLLALRSGSDGSLLSSPLTSSAKICVASVVKIFLITTGASMLPFTAFLYFEPPNV